MPEEAPIQQLAAAAADARETLAGDSNDDEHDALFHLAEAAERYLAHREQTVDATISEVRVYADAGDTKALWVLTEEEWADVEKVLGPPDSQMV